MRRAVLATAGVGAAGGGAAGGVATGGGAATGGAVAGALPVPVLGDVVFSDEQPETAMRNPAIAHVRMG